MFNRSIILVLFYINIFNIYSTQYISDNQGKITNTLVIDEKNKIVQLFSKIDNLHKMEMEEPIKQEKLKEIISELIDFNIKPNELLHLVMDYAFLNSASLHEETIKLIFKTLVILQ